MNCHNCARKTSSLFIRSFANIEPASILRQNAIVNPQTSRCFSADHRPHRDEQAPSRPFDAFDRANINGINKKEAREYERPAWQAQKAALKEKLNGEAWNPRKKLSPDTMEGIRHLHKTQPTKFTTPVLSEHFKVSSEAIRRILKSRWQPNDAEYESRMLRWDKRGERIWSNLVEMGVKPPKRWRDMGVGRSENGERPRWKSNNRNQVDVRDSVSQEFADFVPNDDILPIVDASGKSNRQKTVKVPLMERL